MARAPKGRFLAAEVREAVDVWARQQLRRIRTDMALASWPIGSIFIGTTSTDPAELLGGGTWEQFGEGRMLVGIDSGDTDFDTSEETGGAKTHTLAEANLPAHTHGIDHDHGSFSSGNQSADHTHEHPHTHVLRDARTTATAFGTSGDYAIASTSGSLVTPENSGAASEETTGTQSASHSHTVDVPAFTGTSGSTGSGTAVTHLPPYIVTFMWKRTA